VQAQSFAVKGRTANPYREAKSNTVNGSIRPPLLIRIGPLKSIVQTSLGR
jgi:hypothetical protein